MIRTSYLGLLPAALATASSPAAWASSSLHGQAPASVTIADSGGIQVISPLFLPTVISNGSMSATFASDASSAGTTGGANSGNARLTIRHEAGETLSMTVPSSFTVVRIGGNEALTVNTTTTTGEYGIAGEGILMSGALMNGVATSVDIGGKLALASARTLVPGPYEGLFAVVVAYN